MPCLSCRNWRPVDSSKPEGECLVLAISSRAVVSPGSPQPWVQRGREGSIVVFEGSHLCKVSESALKPQGTHRASALGVVAVMKGAPRLTLVAAWLAHQCVSSAFFPLTSVSSLRMHTGLVATAVCPVTFLCPLQTVLTSRSQSFTCHLPVFLRPLIPTKGECLYVGTLWGDLS